MNLMRVLIAAALLLFVSQGNAREPEDISHGRLQHVRIFTPHSGVNQFVLFLSDPAGWDREAAGVAEDLAKEGAMVAGIDTRELFLSLNQDQAACVFPSGDLENLSRFIQAYRRLPFYYTPIVASSSGSSAFAYAMIAQAPEGVFAGFLSLDFCPKIQLDKPLCSIGSGSGVSNVARTLPPELKTHPPWIDVHSTSSAACHAGAVQDSFKPDAQLKLSTDRASVRQAYSQLSAHLPLGSSSAPANLSDLPLIEVPAANPRSTTFAVLLSGDGGWANIDRALASSLTSAGLSTVGLDSLRYFWTKRTPQDVATDLDRILRYYAAHWKKAHAIVIGFSQGADVLLFALNRLPRASRNAISLAALLSLGDQAQFEFHLSNWIVSDADGIPVRPEVLRLDVPTLCIFGSEDAEAACLGLQSPHLTSKSLPGDHHFNGNYTALTEVILDSAKQPLRR